jgi:hypothetical protein
VTPVVILLYNRAELTRQLIDALRSVRPAHVLLVADGPKPGSERDELAVERTRAELQGIDWPCRVDVNFAAANLGCTARIRSGLDWVFSLVDRAIVLEDDIDPHPSLFSWMAAMLELYQHRDDVAMLCGHNPLIRWPNVARDVCAIPSRRGGVWGWATWARAWRRVQGTSVDGGLAAVDADIDAQGFEPVLAALYRDYLRQARTRPLSWDVDWTLRMAMSKRIAVVSPVNLVHHLGVGPDATHHLDSDDTLFRLPRLPLAIPERLRPLATGADDGAFDRARVLLELLVRAKEPRVALRLAQRPNLRLDPRLRLHLLPFEYPLETLAALDHLRGEGLEVQRYQYWKRALASRAGDGQDD